jgi:hypothetical protein
MEQEQPVTHTNIMRMDLRRIVLITPTWAEAYAVHRALRQSPRKAKVKICGIGPARASAFCKKLDPISLNALVLLGWAGGLSEELKTGDVITASHALMQGESACLCKALSIPGAVIAPIITSKKVLTSTEEKQEARYTGALAVEMEAYPIADWAHQHSIPFTHARVILDALDDPLPQFRFSLKRNIRSRALLEHGHAPVSQKRSGGLSEWIRRFNQANAQLSMLAGLVLQAMEDNDKLETTRTSIL